MARRAGSADLPLHNGRVPAWLGQRMARLGAVIAEAIVLDYGRDEFLRRLAHPFWFQSFGAVMGMDWHSSGITTSVLGALKRGLAPREAELGLFVCGGRGSHSRRTPDELTAIGMRTGLDGAALARASRLVAKVDSAAVQDGFELYLHGFVRRRRRQVGRGPAGDARRDPHRAALPLALRGPQELRRGAARGDRRPRGRRDRQPDRRARRAPRGRGSSTLLRELGPGGIVARGGGARGPRRGAAAAASRHAGTPRRPAEGRDDPPAARRARRRRRPRAGRLRRAPAGAGRRRPHRARRSRWSPR